MLKKLSINSLINTQDLSIEDANIIFELTDFYIKEYKPGIKFDELKGVTVAMAFFEPSTRTKLSFELAAKRLSADTISFQSSTSSLTKGESLIDTLHTIEAMGVQMYVLRHSKSGSPKFLMENTKGAILNAGDGKHSHPTQALLDAYTLRKHFGNIKNLKVCICGDILHSRVARSNIELLKILGADVRLCGPGTLLPRFINIWNCEYCNDINEAIDWADVLLVLRLQRERMEAGILPSIREFNKYFGVSYQQFLRKKDLVIMHPGPVNYGIELDYNISSHPNCLIQTQVTHGVFIRMSLLALLGQRFK